MAAEAPTRRRHAPDFARALRDAAFTALIAFGLFLPLIAFGAVHDIRNELVLETRWPLFAAFVAIAFVGRLIWELLPHERLKPSSRTSSARRALLVAAGMLAGMRSHRGRAGTGVRHRNAFALALHRCARRSRLSLGAGVAIVNIAIRHDRPDATAGTRSACVAHRRARLPARLSADDAGASGPRARSNGSTISASRS